MFKKSLMMAALLLALSPAAHADWLFTPSVGSTFGGESKGNPQFTYGATFGWMGSGALGVETDVAYTPDFFDTSDFAVDFSGGNHVLSWMVNIVAGIPAGGQRGAGFRPYLTGGLGLLQTDVGSSGSLAQISKNEAGFNVGAGVMTFANTRVGFRGDVRYTRSFRDPDRDGDFDVAVGNFDYWRGTVGVIFRW